MWFETKDGGWINEHGIRLMSKTEENICAEVVGHCLEHELTGRISPVPFPGKFVEVKEEKAKSDCSFCEGRGNWIHSLGEMIKCRFCKGTGKVEVKE